MSLNGFRSQKNLVEMKQNSNSSSLGSGRGATGKSSEGRSVKGKPFVVVGIPAFNEGKTIARVVLEAQRYGQVAGLFEVAIAFGVA